MPKVLITGATGFLGSNLAKTFHDTGFEVRVLIRPESMLSMLNTLDMEVYPGRIDVQNDVEKAVQGCDYVIHAASITSQWGISQEEYDRINIHATKLVADACEKYGVQKLIYVSTANAMAPGTMTNPGTERNPFILYKAHSPYINTKYLAQQLVLERAANYHLPAVVINPTFMVGPMDLKPSSGRLLLYHLEKRLFPYPPGGKNIVHVQDVCTGIVNALELGKSGECYLMAGENITYQTLFSLRNKAAGTKQILVPLPELMVKAAGLAGSAVQSLTHRPQPFTRPIAYMACVENYYSSEKAAKAFNMQFQPAEKAISDAMNWFRENGYRSL